MGRFHPTPAPFWGVRFLELPARPRDVKTGCFHLQGMGIFLDPVRLTCGPNIKHIQINSCFYIHLTPEIHKLIHEICSSQNHTYRYKYT